MRYLFLLILLVGCEAPVYDNSPIYGEIINVYREFRLGSSDGTTIVKLQDGRIIKYYGRLGKVGDKINIRGLTPARS